VGVFDEVTMSVLVAMGTLTMDVLLVVSEIWIVTHRIEVTGIILTLQWSTARYAWLASIAQSDVRIKYLLEFFAPLTRRLEVFAFLFDFILVFFGSFLIGVFDDA
jgi:hypothetical protein